MMYGTEWDEKRYLQTFISFGYISIRLSLFSRVTVQLTSDTPVPIECATLIAIDTATQQPSESVSTCSVSIHASLSGASATPYESDADASTPAA